jgi:hypothetical protein
MPESVANAHAFHAEAYRRASVRGGGIAEVAKDDSDGGGGGDDDSPIAAAGQFVASGLNVVSSGINAISRIGAAAEDGTLSNAGGAVQEVIQRGDTPASPGAVAASTLLGGERVTASDPPSTVHGNANENSGSVGLGSRAAFGVNEIVSGGK